MKKSEVFTYDKELLERLKDANLPEPANLMEEINKFPPRMPYSRRTRYVAFYGLFEGKFIERVWAFRENKGKLQHKEVIRSIEGSNKKLIKDMYLSGIGGYNTVWEKRKVNHYWTVEPNDEWFIDSIEYYNLYPKKIFDFEEMVSLDPTIKYCGYNRGSIWGRMNFIDYISWFRVIPEIEMYSKFGFLHLIKDIRFYNKIKKDNKFLKYAIKNRDFIQRNQTNYVNILNAYKKNLSVINYIGRLNIYQNHVYKDNKEFFTEKRIDKILDYLEKQSEDIRYYFDYFNAAKQFVDMNDTKNLYPHNLKEWHDRYIKQLEIKRHEDKKEAFAKVVKRWSWLNYKDDKFMIIVAPTIESIIDEGKQLKHCVGKLGYISNMAKAKNLILFIREIEAPTKSFYTVEFDHKKKEVLQCRGYDNLQNVGWDEVVKFRDKWLSHIEKIERKMKYESRNGDREISEGPRIKIHAIQSCVL